MITIPGTSAIQNIMQGGVASIIPFALIIIGLELGFRILEFFVGKSREKAEKQIHYHQALKDMERLQNYAKKNRLTLKGNFSPDFVQEPGETALEFQDMISLANKYGVKVETEKNVPLN